MATEQLTILLGFFITLVSTQTYYIVPDHTLCPTETTPSASGLFSDIPTDHTALEVDCLTLTQYAQFPATTIHSNITLIFEPGHHTLDSRLQIQYVINSLVLRVASTNSSPNSVAMVTCTNSSGFDLSVISEVSVSGLEFIGCRENSVRWVGKLRMEDCTFQDGHGMELRNVRNATFERSSFISLAAFREAWNPLWRRHELSGGAIVAFSSDINVTECLFEGNRAAGGGAIRTDNSSITVHDSHFSSNRARSDGGAIWTYSGSISIHDSDFSSNTAGWGGAIWTTSGSISIHGSDFSSNTAGNGNGLASTYSISFVHGFRSNTAGSGGAIGTFSGYIGIHSSNFSNNTAGVGGAIETYNGSISIHGSDFGSNTAGDWGGALRTISGSINIDGSDISNNTAGVTGGAIETYNGSISINSACSFSNNRADRDGGAIWTSRGNTTINGSSFINNSVATDGGVIWSDSGRISIHASVFSKNTADSLGGAIKTVSGNIDIHSACDFTNNRADRDGGAILTDSGRIMINGSSFRNNSVATDGGAIWTRNGNISIQVSNLQNNTADRDGGAIWTDSGNLDIHGSNFSNNSAGTDGGAIGTDSGSIKLHDTKFSRNKAATDGGAIWTDSGSISIDKQCSFTTNRADTDGGAIWTVRGNITIHGSKFTNNIASSGGVLRADSGSITINGSVFIENTVLNNGGVLFLGSATDSINKINYSIFNHNHASSQGGAIYVQSRTISLNGLLQITNNLATTGVVYAAQSTLVFSGHTTISDNRASIYVIKSNIKFYGHTNIVNNSQMSHTALIEGGAITASQQSEITFDGTVNISGNAIINGLGGGILLHGSRIHTHGNTTITHNTALSGGGIYAYQSILNFTGSTTITENVGTTKGGGIYASGSTITLTGGQLQFIENRAEEGGGICLELHSRLHVKKAVTDDYKNQSLASKLGIFFTNNSAAYGGALFISDNSSTCDNEPFSRECFLQEIVSHIQEDNLTIVQNIHFETNRASTSGGAIYGGLLNRCTVSPHAQDKYRNGPQLDAISFLTNITNLEERDFLTEISSQTVGLCFCDENNRPDCDKQTPAHKVLPRKGETFSISLVAVDHVNNPVEASVRVSLSSQGDLVQGQDIQQTTSNCTRLNFTITSPHDREELVLDAGGPCSYHKVIHLTFAPCVCPVGFIRTNDKSNCSCECDPCLDPDYIDGCSPGNSSVKRKQNIWISSINYFRNKSQSECLYLTYPHCPFDYCHPPSSPVWINLNVSNGSDSQCAFNRSGKLCGSCKDGLSLSLGSSRCLSCSNNWLALLIVFFIAGIALVAFLLIFNLTVAVGTINGLIFYANILTTNRATFFPFQSPNFSTVFIAWLNLDFGFVTCFFDGMDGYVKEWLQLAFPLYIISLVTMVIIGCEYSTKIARSFIGTNPVATLATLILLSYAKSLRIIIAAFSSASLNNLDGSREIVWLIDGNIRYFDGKHIPLFLVALLILLLGILYTFLLFSYQWLLHCPNKKGLKWIKNARFYPFMDAYLAPYNIKHRYWTGLLLLIRAFLYIMTAININGDPGNNLMAIFCTLICLQIVKSFLPCRVYKSWLLDAMNFTFIINLIFFSFGSLYIRGFNVGNQEALAYTSTSIAFITFLAILTYHTYTFVLKKKTRTKLDSFILKMKLRLFRQELAAPEIILVPRPVVTYSVVDPVPTEQQLLENTKKEAIGKKEREPVRIIKNEPTANTERSSASLLAKKTSDKNNCTSKQISESVMKRLFDESRMDKDKTTLHDDLEPRLSKFSDIHSS